MNTCELCGGPIRSDNKYGICRRNTTCLAEARHRDRDAHAEQYKNRSAAYRRNNRVKNALQQASYRAKDKGLPFNLTEDNAPEVPKMCPVLGVELAWDSGDATPSLDRIRPYEGYVVGNVRWISDRANRLRRDAAPEELIALALDAERLREVGWPYEPG